MILAPQRTFDPTVRHEPDKRDKRVQSIRKPGVNEGEWNGGQIDCERQLTFHIPTEGRGKNRTGTLLSDDCCL